MTHCPRCGSLLVRQSHDNGSASLWCPFLGAGDVFSGYYEPPCRFQCIELAPFTGEESEPVVQVVNGEIVVTGLPSTASPPFKLE